MKRFFAFFIVGFVLTVMFSIFLQSTILISYPRDVAYSAVCPSVGFLGWSARDIPIELPSPIATFGPSSCGVQNLVFFLIGAIFLFSPMLISMILFAILNYRKDKVLVKHTLKYFSIGSVLTLLWYTLINSLPIFLNSIKAFARSSCRPEFFRNPEIQKSNGFAFPELFSFPGEEICASQDISRYIILVTIIMIPMIITLVIMVWRYRNKKRILE